MSLTRNDPRFQRGRVEEEEGRKDGRLEARSGCDSCGSGKQTEETVLGRYNT